MTSYSDIQVDHIIEKVLINNHTNPYKSTTKHHLKSTPQGHIWHYQLQQENQDLKDKLKQLKYKYKKKQENIKKHSQLQQQIQQLKIELEYALTENQQLQRDINRYRLKNDQINQSIRISVQNRQMKQRSKKSCRCKANKNDKRSPIKVESKKRVISIEDSPPKSIIKNARDVSINCQLECHQISAQQIEQRKQRIKSLRQIVANQQKLMKSYERQLNSKSELDKKNTRPSTSRLLFIGNEQAKTGVKIPSSAGSIVKIHRARQIQ